MRDGTRRRWRLGEAAMAMVGARRTSVAVVAKGDEWTGRGTVRAGQPSLSHRGDDTAPLESSMGRWLVRRHERHRNSCRGRTSKGRPGKRQQRWESCDPEPERSRPSRSSPSSAAGCGASATSSASPPTSQGPAGSPAVGIADPGSPAASPSAWPTITPLSASWVKPAADAKDHGLQARADRVDRRRGLRGDLQAGLVRVIRGLQREEAELGRDLVVHGRPAEVGRPARQAQGVLRCAGSVGQGLDEPRPDPDDHLRRGPAEAGDDLQGRLAEGNLERNQHGGDRQAHLDRARGLRDPIPPLWRQGLPERLDEDRRPTVPGGAHEAPGQESRAHQDDERIDAIGHAHAYDARRGVRGSRSGAVHPTAPSAPSSCAPTTPTASPRSRSS